MNLPLPTWEICWWILRTEKGGVVSISPVKFVGSIYHFHPFLYYINIGLLPGKGWFDPWKLTTFYHEKKVIEIVPFALNLAVHKFNKPLPVAETPHSTRQRFALRLTALFRCKTRLARGLREMAFLTGLSVCWEVVWNPPFKTGKGILFRMSSMVISLKPNWETNNYGGVAQVNERTYQRCIWRNLSNGKYAVVAKCLIFLCSKLLMLSFVHDFLRYINMTAETYVGTMKEEAATAFKQVVCSFN